MTEQFAEKQLALQQVITEHLKTIQDPNKRYDFLCNLRADFQMLTAAISDFESSRDSSEIERLFSKIKL